MKIDWQDWPGSTRVLAATLAAGVTLAVYVMIPSPLSYLAWSGAEPPQVRMPNIPKLREPAKIEAYASIAARPLFNADRKPDPLPPPPEPPKPKIVLADLNQFKLVGVIVSGESRIALVRRAGTSTLTLRVGDTLDGWKVEKIDAQGVGLSGGDRQDSLKIPQAANKAAALPNVRAQSE